MTTPVERQDNPTVACPSCETPMRKEFDGVRVPPMPNIFWFCTNAACGEGKQNKLYSGG